MEKKINYIYKIEKKLNKKRKFFFLNISSYNTYKFQVTIYYKKKNWKL
jgi:hypothetical protein